MTDTGGIFRYWGGGYISLALYDDVPTAWHYTSLDDDDVSLTATFVHMVD